VGLSPKGLSRFFDADLQRSLRSLMMWPGIQM
jgi:hypothetical protein